MPQARGTFFRFNQNGWSYSNACRLHLLFALSKEGASRNIEGIDRYRYESRHETIRVAPRLPKDCQKKAPDPSVQVRGLQTPCFSYPHSFTLVCRGVIPAYSSWVVDYSRHTAESRRVTSSGCLGQNVGQRRKLFSRRRPAVSFLPPGQKRAGFGVRNYSKRLTKRLIVIIETYLAKRIVAGSFIGSRYCRSRGMRKGDKRKNRYWRLCLRAPEQRLLAISPVVVKGGGASRHALRVRLHDAGVVARNANREDARLTCDIAS